MVIKIVKKVRACNSYCPVSANTEFILPLK